MKNLSLEKRAIDFIKQMVSNGQLSQGVVEKYFPELKENEDARIREELLEYCIDRRDGKQVCVDASDYRRWADWLERQSKQTSCEVLFPVLKKEKDERIRKALISILKSDFEKDTTIYGISVGDIIDWLGKIPPQNRWEPSNKQMKALRYVYQNLNPPLSDKRGWDSIKTLELMYQDLKKLKEE